MFVLRESNPGQLLGRQLCSPLYHRRLSNSLLDTLFEDTTEKSIQCFGLKVQGLIFSFRITEKKMTLLCVKFEFFCAS